ncbi:hypothetical protein lerEdw1_009438 [Lerista edwardsae]|nr:hypothetical protein lerEdw1_009438 [Lerista edwardsae]
MKGQVLVGFVLLMTLAVALANEAHSPDNNKTTSLKVPSRQNHTAGFTGPAFFLLPLMLSVIHLLQG